MYIYLYSHGFSLSKKPTVLLRTSPRVISLMSYGGNIGDPWKYWQPYNPFLEMMAAIDSPEAGGQE